MAFWGMVFGVLGLAVGLAEYLHIELPDWATFLRLRSLATALLSNQTHILFGAAFLVMVSLAYAVKVLATRIDEQREETKERISVAISDSEKKAGARIEAVRSYVSDNVAATNVRLSGLEVRVAAAHAQQAATVVVQDQQTAQIQAVADDVQRLSSRQQEYDARMREQEARTRELEVRRREDEARRQADLAQLEYELASMRESNKREIARLKESMAISRDRNTWISFYWKIDAKEKENAIAQSDLRGRIYVLRQNLANGTVGSTQREPTMRDKMNGYCADRGTPTFH